MKEHLFKVIAILSLLFAVSARSQTLNWASLTQSTIVDSEGQTLNNSFLFEVGTFAPDFIPTATNTDQWLQNWRVYDSVSTTSSTVDHPGSYNEEEGYFGSSRDAQDVTGYEGMFEGLKGYIFIYNDAKDEYFLASTDAWVFPELESTCCPQSMVSWSIGDLRDGTPIWGTQGDYVDGGGPYFLQTQPVPETASALLLMLGACFSLSRRRRQNA